MICHQTFSVTRLTIIRVAYKRINEYTNNFTKRVIEPLHITLDFSVVFLTFVKYQNIFSLKYDIFVLFVRSV
jgi:hypothetical protein